MARAKNALDDNAYQLLLKNHIKSLDELRFVHRDEEVVVARYQPFLEECARKTSRISVAMLQKAAIDHFGCSHSIAHQFANAMANAFSFCFQKIKSASTGKKLSDASKAVLMAASGDRSEQRAVKLSALQQNMGCNSSSISSSSPCFSVLLPTTATAAAAAPSESKADPPTDAADILAVYGCIAKVATAGAQQPRSLERRISVVSSQEVLSSQEVAKPEDEASKTEVLALVVLPCLLLRRQGIACYTHRDACILSRTYMPPVQEAGHACLLSRRFVHNAIHTHTQLRLQWNGLTTTGRCCASCSRMATPRSTSC